MPNEASEINANDIIVDTGKAEKILRLLIRWEVENVRTKVDNDTKMVSKIQNLIKEEVEQRY